MTMNQLQHVSNCALLIEVTTQGQHPTTNMNTTRLKILADTAIRDLLLMEEIIDMVRETISKSKVSPVAAVW